MDQKFVEFQDRVRAIGGHFVYSKCHFDKSRIWDFGFMKDCYICAVFDDAGAEQYSVVAAVGENEALEEANVYLTLPGIPGQKDCTWENVAELYKEGIEDRVSSEIDALIEAGKIEGVTKSGIHMIEKWEPDEWALSPKELATVLGDEHSAWTAYLEILQEKILMNPELERYEFEEIKKSVVPQLSDVARDIAQLPDFDLDEYLQERVFVEYNPDDWNPMIRVNLLIDSGNWKYDCNCDDLLNPDLSEERRQCSSVLYVADLLGKKAELEKALADDRKTEDPFVVSTLKELENCPYQEGATMVFLAKIPLHRLLDVLDAQKEAKKHPEQPVPKITMPKCTFCGLFNPWNGSGSLLDIDLPDKLSIPVDKTEVQVEEVPGIAYSVGRVYGFIPYAWREAEYVKA